MYDDHETRIVQRMKQRQFEESVSTAQTVGAQVAAFYRTLVLNGVRQLAAEDMAHTFLVQLFQGNRCNCEGCADE